MQQQTKSLGKLIGLSLLLALVTAALCAERGGRRVPAGQKADESAAFKSPCGTAEEVANQLGGCLAEIFELIEGRFGEPKTDLDVQGHCSRFNRTERCARTKAKDCLQGLHKTAVGAVASATRRFRVEKCKTPANRARYIPPLKCAIKQGEKMKAMYRNYTGMLQGISELNTAPEQKLMKMCCVLNEVDVTIAQIFNEVCPDSTPIILEIVHAMTDDARSTLCVAPKCQGALTKVRGHKYTPPQNFIEPIMMILFQINTN